MMRQHSVSMTPSRVVLLTTALLCGISFKAHAQPNVYTPPKPTRMMRIQIDQALASKVGTDSLEPPVSKPDADSVHLLELTTNLFDFSAAALADTTGATPQHFNMLSYNKYTRPVGPTIRVKRGTTLKIRVKNSLKGPDDSSPGANLPNSEYIHGLSTTNLHTHGLHVSPTDKNKSVHGDNIFFEIAPSSEGYFEYEIPANHPSGTFWYHPHKHGSVGYQLGNGLAGALIVEGEEHKPYDLESIPQIRAAAERILLLQWYTFSTYPDPTNAMAKIGFIDARNGAAYNINKDPNLSSAADLKVPIDKATPASASTNALAINGQLVPTYKIKPGEVERWRMIHAGWDQLQQLTWTVLDPTTNIYVETNDIKFFEIALDGLATGSMTRRSDVEIAPGQRSDLLVKVEERARGKQYHLRGVSKASLLGTGDFTDNSYTVAILAVGDEAHHMNLPDPSELAACRPFKSIPDSAITPATVPAPPGGTAPVNSLTFRAQDPQNPPDLSDAYYTINGRTFMSNTANPIELTLGKPQEWIINAGSKSLPGPANTVLVVDSSHPFHIHVNAFQVVEFTDLSGQRWPRNEWRDTLFVPAGTSYRIRLQFKDFSGYSVLHCHILDHEDQGMMMPIKLVDPNGPPLGAPPWQHMLVPPKAAWKPDTLRVVNRPAPKLSLPDPGNPGHAIADYRGKPVVLVFFAGIQCTHCSGQLRELVREARRNFGNDTEIVAVSSRGIPDRARADEQLGLRSTDHFRLLQDEKHTAFRAFGCYVEDSPKHGLFVIDRDGVIRHGFIGDAPFDDIPSVVKAVKTLAASDKR